MLIYIYINIYIYIYFGHDQNSSSLRHKQIPKQQAEDHSIFMAPYIWNSISLSIRQSPSYISLKKNLKTYLFRYLA